jgi:helicase
MIKMLLKTLPLPDYFKEHYNKITKLHPAQEKAVKAGLLQNKSLLVCSPTASGKTLIATMAIVNTITKGKAVYLVPLKALANEKFKEYQKLFQNTDFKVIMSTGDIDSDSPFLSRYNLIILTCEKFDSLIRHKVSWLAEIKTVIIDEIHLLNDSRRGPTLEIIITLLKSLIKPQIIGLSATIGNPQELADWLEAELVLDNWRPVKLKQGILKQGTHNKKIEFYD